MPRVSKRPVSEKLLSKTYRLFYEVFSRNKGQDDFFADIMIHPGIYKGHWQLYWDHKRKQENRKILV